VIEPREGLTLMTSQPTCSCSNEHFKGRSVKYAGGAPGRDCNSFRGGLVMLKLHVYGRSKVHFVAQLVFKDRK